MIKIFAPLALAVLALGACDGASSRRSADAAESSVAVTPPAPRVRNISIGKAADSTLRITTATTDFKARDTVYLAVEVQNPDANSRLTARWTFQDGAVVDSSGQSVDRDMGVAGSVTQFRVRRDDGWPLGNYTVDVWLNGTLVGTKNFSVLR